MKTNRKYLNKRSWEESLKEGMSRLEIMKYNKALYSRLEKSLNNLPDGLKKYVIKYYGLPWCKNNNWLGGMSDSASNKAIYKILSIGDYTTDEILDEIDNFIDCFISDNSNKSEDEKLKLYLNESLNEGSSSYTSDFEDFVERVDDTSSEDELRGLYDEVNSYGFNMSDLHYLTYLIFKKMKSLEESLNEDLFDKPRNIADSICKYLDSKNFYNYELVDYDAYPMNTSKITFEVDGDWKHDHWRFKDLVYDWSFDNNKSIYKMESELVRDDGSDSYASDYFIYVTENEDSLNALKSMSKLFSEEYELDVDNWQYLDVDQDYNPSKDYFIPKSRDKSSYFSKKELDKDEFTKRFKKYPEFTEVKVDIYTDPPYYTFDDVKKEAEKYNIDIPVYYKENSSGILRGTKSDIVKYLSSMLTMDEIKDDYPELFESLNESSNKNIISNIESKLFSIIKKYFHDDNYSYTQGIKITESNYDLLRYTARPYSNYRSTSSKLIMDDDRYLMSEFKSEVRNYLKQFGVTKIKFDTKKLKLHYGYISGPDDFPVVCLNAIYFNDINNGSLDEEKIDKLREVIKESLNEASYGGAFDIEDDQFFTRDDINEFSLEVADSLSSEFGKTFDVSDSYMETPKRLHLEVTDGDYDYFANIDINMRRIRSPRDLYKYKEEAINQIKGQF